MIAIGVSSGEFVQGAEPGGLWAEDELQLLAPRRSS
jgi:hypothetical protein